MANPMILASFCGQVTAPKTSVRLHETCPLCHSSYWVSTVDGYTVEWCHCGERFVNRRVGADERPDKDVVSRRDLVKIAAAVDKLDTQDRQRETARKAKAQKRRKRTYRTPKYGVGGHCLFCHEPIIVRVVRSARKRKVCSSPDCRAAYRKARRALYCRRGLIGNVVDGTWRIV